MSEIAATIPALVAIIFVMLMVWGVSIYLKNVAVIDLYWGPVIALAGCLYFGAEANPTVRAKIALVFILLWAIRLAVYLAIRNAGKPEDRRYADMRERHNPGFAYKSLYMVFLLQAVIAWLVSFALYGAMSGVNALGLIDYLGIGLFVFGLIWETAADWQLMHFLNNKTNDDQVMDKGVWRYSRHPNYFGEFCLWWGIWLLAASAGAYWTIISPLLLSFFLLKVSGVTMLEKDIGDRRPAYARYIERTSAFIPRPPSG